MKNIHISDQFMKLDRSTIEKYINTCIIYP